MPHEIERRFLVKPDVNIESLGCYYAEDIEQSYLSGTGDWTIRARKVSNKRRPYQKFSVPFVDDVLYFITMKSAVSNTTNIEIETQIDEKAYLAFLEHSGIVLCKTRYSYMDLVQDGPDWEIDVYAANHPGFQTIAEIELSSEDQEFDIPNWVEREVTGDRSYSNFALAQRLALSVILTCATS